jgi:hypothetical protein
MFRESSYPLSGATDLSDHNAQLICLQNGMVGIQQYVPKRKTRIINEQTIKHFQMLLNDETWNTVHKATCVNEMYNHPYKTF